ISRKVAKHTTKMLNTCVTSELSRRQLLKFNQCPVEGLCSVWHIGGNFPNKEIYIRIQGKLGYTQKLVVGFVLLDKGKLMAALGIGANIFQNLENAHVCPLLSLLYIG